MAAGSCWPLYAAKESPPQAGWEGLLQDLYRRGLKGEKLEVIVTDGCPGLAAALAVVYPHVEHQRCWFHKMRNIVHAVRRRDQRAVTEDAQAIYQADSRGDGGFSSL